MAQIGPSISLSSIGPSGNPDIAFSNLFAVFQSPWGIDNIWQTCSSFQDFLRLYGGLNKLTTVASGTTADTYTVETTAAVVQAYYAIKGYFDEKGSNSPGVLYACRVIQTASPPTAAVYSPQDYSATYTTTITAKWKGRDGATVQATIINPSPRKGIFTAQTSTTVSTTSGSPTVTNSGTGFTTGSTWVGWGIQIGSSYYTIQSVGTTSSLTLTTNATATTSAQTWAVGNNTTSAYIKLYHPQSGIVEEWDIGNSFEAADASKKSQLATISLPAGGQLPQSVTAAKLNSGTPATADAYAATAANYVGTTSAAGVKTGLQVFNDQRLGSGFVTIPGKYDSTSRSGLLTHCNTYYRHALLGSGSGLTQTTVVGDQANLSSQHASYFWPQVWVTNQNSDSSGQILIDPVGHIAGLGARMDRDKGAPHKSPAGVKYPLVSVLDVERQSSGAELADDAASNTLADSLINTIRVKGLPASGIVVWGIRTLASDGRFRQIPVSRTVDYIYLAGLQILEKYIMDELSPVLFTKVKGDLDAFLDSLHEKGALYGKKPGKEITSDAAWYVSCDEGNNPGVSLGSGELHADVYVVPAPNIERITVNLYAAAPGFVGKQQ